MLVDNTDDIQVIKQKLHEAFDLQKTNDDLPSFTASIGVVEVDFNQDIKLILEQADKDMLARKSIKK